MNWNGRNYTYTRNGNDILTERQRIFYEENGYLHVPQLVPPELLEKCNQRFEDINTGKVKSGAMTVMRDIIDRKSINKIQEICFDDVFSEYIEYQPLLDIVEAVTGPNILAMHSMFIAKPPDAGMNSSRHPPHQDLAYFPFRPANSIVAAWTAIEVCDTSNGCLYVAPGSHRFGKMLPHGYSKKSKADPVNKFFYEIHELPESMFWVNLEVQPGDTLFFHPFLVHGSGINRSTRTRKAISCHYAAGECEYVDIKNTLQEQISKEISAVNTKRFSFENCSYQDLWRLKAKLVRGVRSSL